MSDPICRDLHRYSLARTPSPLDKIRALSESLGADIFLKRDDCLDELGCGHKLRSLEYLIPYHQSAGCDCVVTFGSRRSNHTKAVALSCAKVGLEVHVLMGGDTFKIPSTLHGSCLLTALSGAHMVWCEGITWHQMQARANTFCAELVRTNKKPALIGPEHGIFPGILGFIRLGMELREQLGAPKSPTNIILPVGTGSLAAGLAVANVIGGFGWNLLGICLTLSQEAALQSIKLIVDSFLQRSNAPVFTADVVLSSLHLFDDIAYRTYDRFDAETLQLCSTIFARTGVLFEPNYMLKCYLATQKLVLANKLSDCATNVMIHTGGQFSLLDLPVPITPSSTLLNIG